MPMNGRTYKEIKIDMGKIELKLNEYKLKGKQYKVIDSVLKNVKVKNPVECLSKSIGKLAKADIAYFAKGWENARGCKIEHEIAKQYGIEIMEE